MVHEGKCHVVSQILEVQQQQCVTWTVTKLLIVTMHCVAAWSRALSSTFQLQEELADRRWHRLKNTHGGCAAFAMSAAVVAFDVITCQWGSQMWWVSMRFLTLSFLPLECLQHLCTGGQQVK